MGEHAPSPPESTAEDSSAERAQAAALTGRLADRLRDAVATDGRVSRRAILGASVWRAPAP